MEGGGRLPDGRHVQQGDDRTLVGEQAPFHRRPDGEPAAGDGPGGVGGTGGQGGVVRGSNENKTNMPVTRGRHHLLTRSIHCLECL
ncbi:hypothetical protein GCM10010405_44700 [Streptomyces macrosporus]|uniref:Uncharacterized protein n=1 Tax=Streptomyces macrosporus TaxID=44032 RepID=A0ABN3KCD1_9ACTN